MLRLDDTDRERSTPQYAEAIERDLGWLRPNVGPLRARQTGSRYAEALKLLKTRGRVYPCF